MPAGETGGAAEIAAIDHEIDGVHAAHYYKTHAGKRYRIHAMANPDIFPAVRYKDGPAAMDWLGRAFGFERHFVVPGPDDTVAHAQLILGSGMIMMGSGRHDPPNPWDAVSQGIYVHVPDIEAHYARAKTAGAEIVMELHETDYGSREYSARDPEGHLWAFGTYDPWK